MGTIRDRLWKRHFEGRRTSRGDSDDECGDFHAHRIDMGRLCWMYAYQLIDFEQRLLIDDFEDIGTGNSPDYERGYAAGMRNTAEDVLQQLEAEGVETVEQAVAYAEEKDVALVPVWIEDVEVPWDVDDVALWREDKPGMPHFKSLLEADYYMGEL